MNDSYFNVNDIFYFLKIIFEGNAKIKMEVQEKAGIGLKAPRGIFAYRGVEHRRPGSWEPQGMDGVQEAAALQGDADRRANPDCAGGSRKSFAEAGGIHRQRISPVAHEIRGISQPPGATS